MAEAEGGPGAADRDELQFLAMFHYAVGAMAAMVSLVPALQLFVAANLTPEGEPIDSILVRLFGERGAAAAAGVLLVLGFALGGLLIAAGHGLARCRSYRLCRTASIFGIFFPPFGTALGMYTLSRLLRPETRALFLS